MDDYSEPEEPNVVVVIPAPPLELGSVEYPSTTNYHWPNFDKNATGAEPGDFEEVMGPNLFLKGTEIKEGKCLIDNNFAKPDDPCIRNPKNCENGFSFSFFHKAEYDRDAIEIVAPENNHTKEYLASNGGEPGSPGFSIYRMGGTIGAVVSFDNLFWRLEVVGNAPQEGKWTNIAIKWQRPLFNTEEELSDLLYNQSLPLSSLGGLQLFVDLEPRGQIFQPLIYPRDLKQEEMKDVEWKESENAKAPREAVLGSAFDPPAIMLGCHRTQRNKTQRFFGKGFYDELAFWDYALPKNEEIKFLGGYEFGLEELGDDSLLKLVNFIDYSDPAQANIAASIIGAVISSDLEEGLTTNAEGNADSGNTGSDGGGSAGETTTAPTKSDTDSSTISDGETPAKRTITQKEAKDWIEVRNLMGVSEKMLNTDKLGKSIGSQEFGIRMKFVGSLGEFLSNKGKFKGGWEVNNRFPGRPTAHKTRENILKFAHELILRRNVSISGDEVNDAVTQEVAQMVSKPNFALQAKKQELKNFMTQKTQPDGYVTFPDWDSDEWSGVKDNFEPIPSSSPSERVDFPVDIVNLNEKVSMLKLVNNSEISDITKGNLLNLIESSTNMKLHVLSVGSISDDFPDAGQKSPVSIFANKAKLDSRVVTLEMSVSLGTDISIPIPVSADKPLKVTLGSKSARYNFGRDLKGFFDHLEGRSRVQARHCVIFDPTLSTSGLWTTHGVTTVYADDSEINCYATKWGTFAVLAEIETDPPKSNEEIYIKIFRGIGDFLSLIALIFFIVVILTSSYLVKDMIYILAMNVAIGVLFGQISRIFSDFDFVREDRDACFIFGSFVHFFYLAAAFSLASLSVATLRALAYGVIGGLTKAYVFFNWGLSFIVIGFNIASYFDLMGIDPRCMIAWDNDPKWVFFLPKIGCLVFSLIVCAFSMCNVGLTLIRKKEMAEDMVSFTPGLFFFVIYYLLTWALFPNAYMVFPRREMVVTYPAFAILNSFMGLILVVALGIGSRRFKAVILGKAQDRKRKMIQNEKE